MSNLPKVFTDLGVVYPKGKAGQRQAWRDAHAGLVHEHNGFPTPPGFGQAIVKLADVIEVPVGGMKLNGRDGTVSQFTRKGQELGV